MGFTVAHEAQSSPELELNARSSGGILRIPIINRIIMKKEQNCFGKEHIHKSVSQVYCNYKIIRDMRCQSESIYYSFS